MSVVCMPLLELLSAVTNSYSPICKLLLSCLCNSVSSQFCVCKLSVLQFPVHQLSHRHHSRASLACVDEATPAVHALAADPHRTRRHPFALHLYSSSPALLRAGSRQPFCFYSAPFDSAPFYLVLFSIFFARCIVIVDAASISRDDTDVTRATRHYWHLRVTECTRET